MSYAQNKEAAKTYTDTPSMTDQAGANDTDINVIVGRFMVHGQVPGDTREPLYEDWSSFPDDLRGFLEQGREVENLKNRLPKELQEMSISELMNLTTEELSKILEPTEKPPAEPKPEEPKGDSE